LGRYYNPKNIAKEVCVFAHRDNDWQMSPSVRVTGYQSFKELELKCKAFKPDILTCYEAVRPFCYYALRIASNLGIPSYLSLHDNRIQYNPILSNFTAITGCSETIARRAAKILHRDVETRLYADIPPEIFRPLIPQSIDPRVASAKHRIFTIIRKDPVKNVGTVIKATEILSKRVGSVAHVIGGPSSEEIAYDGVHLGLGSLSQQMVVEYLNWCSCFLQVQFIPEISRAPAEALTIGRPVIITGNPDGIAHYVIDETRGILIPMEKVTDAQFIANAVFDCLNRQYDPVNIRKWALERYDAEELEQKEAERYTKLYSMKHQVKYSNTAKMTLFLMTWRARFRYDM
jgi:glycosyltransferase involved in cell wall biosynthesis